MLLTPGIALHCSPIESHREQGCIAGRESESSRSVNLLGDRDSELSSRCNSSFMFVTHHLSVLNVLTWPSSPICPSHPWEPRFLMPSPAHHFFTFVSRLGNPEHRIWMAPGHLRPHWEEGSLTLHLNLRRREPGLQDVGAWLGHHLEQAGLPSPLITPRCKHSGGSLE